VEGWDALTEGLDRPFDQRYHPQYHEPRLEADLDRHEELLLSPEQKEN
jgi:hypothetical protein